MGNQPPLALQPLVSRQLAVFIGVTHGLAALVAVLMPGMEWWGKGALLIPIAVSLGYFWRLHIARTAAQSVQEAVFYQVDNWLVRTPSGSHFARLDDSSFLHPWLCVLNLRSQKGKLHTLVLLPDSLPQEVLRQLRVRVKFSTDDKPQK